jgi:glycosyltransferase involved in cell wall biosynthesis
LGEGFGSGASRAIPSAAGRSVGSGWRRAGALARADAQVTAGPALAQTRREADGRTADVMSATVEEPPASWIAEHSNWHAGVEPEVLQQDLVLAGALGDGWKPILKHYDVVQCYSVDGIIPMSHGRRDFLCYEHGTLRSIPFEPTPIGRLTATAYRLAARSFVTNLDNLQSCRRLKLAPDRVVPLPHALDDEKIHAFARRHAHIRPSGHDAPEFLSPSRQHWLDKDPNLAKGNDIFFDTLARLKAQGYRARVTLVAWGRDLEASKSYIRDIGIEDFVTWVPPMTGEELWKRCLGCHAVVDQFIIPAFGRVTFDSLLLGKPVITNLDVGLATEFFTVAPPILVSATVDDTERALKRILDDPEDKQGLGAASAAWAAAYHSTQRILDLQVEAYRQMFAERTAKAAEKPAPRAIG